MDERELGLGWGWSRHGNLADLTEEVVATERIHWAQKYVKGFMFGCGGLVLGPPPIIWKVKAKPIQAAKKGEGEGVKVED